MRTFRVHCSLLCTAVAVLAMGCGTTGSTGGSASSPAVGGGQIGTSGPAGGPSGSVTAQATPGGAAGTALVGPNGLPPTQQAEVAGAQNSGADRGPFSNSAPTSGPVFGTSGEGTSNNEDGRGNANSGTGGANTSSGSVGTGPSAGQSQATTVRLSQLNGSGVLAGATLTDMGNGRTRVDLRVEGSSGSHPSHIHEGTCTNLNPMPRHPLNSVQNGTSTTEVAVPLPDLLGGRFAINLHKSDAEMDVYVACGEIQDSQRGPTTP